MAGSSEEGNVVYWERDQTNPSTPTSLAWMERKSGVLVGKYRSHAAETRQKKSKRVQKQKHEEKGKVNVTIKDLDNAEKKRIASLIQELARSTEEREIAVDRLKHAHASLQQQNQELNQLVLEKEQLLARNVECQSIVKEYQKQLIVQEATLLQLKQSAMFHRTDRECQAELATRSDKQETQDHQWTSGGGQHKSSYGRETDLPHQLWSDGQTKLYTLRQEMESAEQISGNSNMLGREHVSHRHSKGVQCELFNEMVTELHCATRTKQNCKLPIGIEPTSETSSENSVHQCLVTDGFVDSIDPTGASEGYEMKHKAVQTFRKSQQTSCHSVITSEHYDTEHKAVQTCSDQQQPSCMSRGCQTMSVQEFCHQTYRDCETQTASCLSHQSVCSYVTALVDVGVQTDHFELYQDYAVEHADRFSLSTLSYGRRIGEPSNGSSDNVLISPVCLQHGISKSLLELIDELDFIDNVADEKVEQSLAVSDVDSVDENSVLSEIFFLSS